MSNEFGLWTGTFKVVDGPLQCRIYDIILQRSAQMEIVNTIQIRFWIQLPEKPQPEPQLAYNCNIPLKGSVTFTQCAAPTTFNFIATAVALAHSSRPCSKPFSKSSSRPCSKPLMLLIAVTLTMVETTISFAFKIYFEPIWVDGGNSIIQNQRPTGADSMITKMSGRCFTMAWS